MHSSLYAYVDLYVFIAPGEKEKGGETRDQRWEVTKKKEEEQGREGNEKRKRKKLKKEKQRKRKEGSGVEVAEWR